MAKKGDNLSKTLHLHPNHAGEHPLYSTHPKASSYHFIHFHFDRRWKADIGEVDLPAFHGIDDSRPGAEELPPNVSPQKTAQAAPGHKQDRRMIKRRKMSNGQFHNFSL
jgi:hypothetical protein